ncbi:hypothetical protein COCMIDRAFT_28952 [Bipolaris oryzae ATCC 44560]|uniref:Secreted protein n=1 Tax=Bipolaris oryzae ATCC 44560 TaxID=930090 RepID=W6Z450_COCMI|nr:uncharacterized protein COCMIDRAFT_28952 [Bipolaris oryzae ATCC 44560]EUC42409.1 hypothetical protein COCMIDRAFT_28952 [Bipolaris oryzae ATCC 44560]
MRVAILAVAIPGALAQIWSDQVCNGNGGCVTWGIGPGNHPWVCPDGSRLTIPIYTGDWRDAGRPNVPAAKPEDFPKTCYLGRYPAAGDKLMKTTTRGGQTLYTWLRSNCKDGKPAAPGNCYNFNPNPTGVDFCGLYDSNGGLCATNRTAGECERWGNLLRPQCDYWKPGLVDIPEPYYQGRVY